MAQKKLLYWFVQLVGWTAYFLFSILLLSNRGDWTITWNLVLFVTLSIIISIFLSHLIRYVIISANMLSRKLLEIILYTIALCVIASFLLEWGQFFITELVTVDYVEIEEEDLLFRWPDFLFAVSRSIILFFLWCGFYYAFIISEKSRAQEILNLKWEASKNEIELKNLRAQLNPHFLFNSLNSIRALIGLNPEQAKTSVTQLSTLLRRSINLGKMKLIPLKEELDLVRIYLGLEQVRFEERLRTSFDIDPSTLSLEIPPLMIQTIVENAIKHGVSQAVDGGEINIRTTQEHEKLSIRISNSGEIKQADAELGIGIKNTKKRLEILFGENAHFRIEQKGEHVVVTIEINYK